MIYFLIVEIFRGKIVFLQMKYDLENLGENYDDTIYNTFESGDSFFPIDDFIDDTIEEVSNDVSMGFDDISNEIVDTTENAKDLISTEIDDINDTAEESLDDFSSSFDDSVKRKIS